MRLAKHSEKVRQRAIAFYEKFRGKDAVNQRKKEIADLDQKQFKGRTVYRIRCNADFGIGPHEQWLEEHLMWHLMDLAHYLCPYHR